MVVALGVLGAGSVLASGMPRGAAWLLAAAALLHASRLAWVGSRHVPVAVAWDGGADLVRVDGAVVESPTLQWRGPLALLAWRDAHGRRRRLVWWSDTLDARARRELRLAAGPSGATRAGAAVAP